ncbi:MAG TPA: hypothetical protein VGV59_03120 [Pyrinomonadaceae bacterium]|nr:hypothetical protein [Pyrinomonadaceae bacterium]
MRKLFLVALMIVASVTASFAQDSTSASQNNGENIPSQGRAPSAPDGVGRLDLRVVDEDGNPVKGVRADLESHRAGGFVCESWNWTDARGVAVLPPLHMGRLVLKLKANGYQTQKLEVPASSLNEPVRVTMVRKK